MGITTRYRDKSLGSISPADVSLETLPVVELSNEQLRTVEELAKDRNKSYQSIDGGLKFGEAGSLTNHQKGVLGELAVANRYNVKIDSEIYDFGDDGTDLKLGQKTVDVKATATDKMRLPQLLVRSDKELSADLYFRVHILDQTSSGARVRLIGYASKARVEDRDPQRHPGSTKNYVVEPSELTLPPCVRL